MWIKPTKKKIGKYKVGEVFNASTRNARVFLALGIAEEVEAPKPKRKYVRRDIKPVEQAVFTPDDSDV